MANTLKAASSNVICGLGTWTHTIATDGMYATQIRTTNHSPSGISISIAQTGSTSVSITSTPESSVQRHIEMQKVFNCITGDVITITLSSAVPTDQQLNNVKTIARINQGQS